MVARREKTPAQIRALEEQFFTEYDVASRSYSAEFLQAVRADAGLLSDDDTRTVYQREGRLRYSHPFLGFHPMDITGVVFVICRVCQGTTRDGLCPYCRGQGGYPQPHGPAYRG